jgi:hypothetical protein
MPTKAFDLRFLVLGLVLGGLLLGSFVLLAAARGMRTGFYGVPPNATWYQGYDQGPGGASPAAATARHGAH